MKDNSISIHYIKSLVDVLNLHGKNSEQFLKKFEISNEMLSTPSLRFPCEVLVALVRHTWRELRDENMGFSRKSLPTGGFYYGGRLAISSENLGKALEVIIGFYNYIDHGYQIKTSIKNDEFEIQVMLDSPELDSEHFLIEFILAGFHRFSCWLTGKPIILKSVEFDFPPPAHESEYGLFFSCPKKFNANKVAIRFNSKYLDDPITKKYTDLNEYIATTPMNIILNPVDEDNYTTKVKRIIEAYDDFSYPKFDEIAKQLYMVPKTLRTKLSEEGITYQKIKDVIRKDLAIYYLYQPHYSVADIAEKIGFTETGAFIRAFKGWTELTPGAYRNKYIK